MGNGRGGIRQARENLAEKSSRTKRKMGSGPDLRRPLHPRPGRSGLERYREKTARCRPPGPMLLQDPDTDRRYEVEIQLGATDESHIIRTIEYWDIERKRYPQYEHCAVLVAENVTSRFLNVVSLFNGTIPIVAIQFQALKIGEYISLVFTTVMDELTRGLVDEDEESQPPADRSYWEQRGSKATVSLADQLLETIREFASGVEPKYNKYYIGLSENGRVNNFIALIPQKNRLRLRIFLERSQETDEQLEQQTDLDFSYNRHRRAYDIDLNKDDIVNRSKTLKELMHMAYERKTL